MARNAHFIALDERHAAPNYHPLGVAAASAEGSWIIDVESNRYFDMLSAYSALNFGHRHPRLVGALIGQLDRLTLTSRAIHNDQLGRLSRELADLCRMESVLLMNTGAEAVETAIKLARKWGYQRRSVTPGLANIVVAENNFHGRTISIISFSSDPSARDDFGPFTPGFRPVPFGDAQAMSDAIDDNTVAVLIEPIQGEAGVIIPPDGYLRQVRNICTRHGVLFIADEIQSGLGRTGLTFACDHEEVAPDVLILGKALGGGLLPISAVVTSRDIMSVIRPGEHGSTFGGNPLAAAVAREVVAILDEGEIQRDTRALSELFATRLTALAGGVEAVRVRGLWAGLDLNPSGITARQFTERLLSRGVIAKDAHGHTIRFAPPLTSSATDLRWALDQVAAVVSEERTPVVR